MAKKKTSKQKKGFKKPDFQLNDRNRLIVGISLVFIGLLLALSIISFYFNWKYDQSNLDLALDTEPAQKPYRKSRCFMGNLWVYKGLGVSHFLIPYYLCSSGL